MSTFNSFSDLKDKLLSDIDFKKAASVFDKVFKKSMENNEHVNVLITGKSGVGKSTLINAMFGEYVAPTGTGTPVTQQTQLFESDTTSVRIYDTKGFEISGADETANEIKNLIREKNGSTKKDDIIGVIWYAIAANAGRIEKTEINFIKELVGANIDVPVIIVLTKADNREEFIPLRHAIEEEDLDIDGIVNVLATNEPQYHPVSGKKTGEIDAYGLDELAEMTEKVLPDIQKIAFTNQQRVNNELKEKQRLYNRSRANAIITTSVAATFGEGFAPIPLADSAMMIPTQMGMIAGITAVYSVDLSKNAVASLVTTLAGTQAAAFAGRLVVSNILKLIPGVGTVTGGLISGGTGATITAAIGLAYVKLIEMSEDAEWKGVPFEDFLNKVDIESVINSVGSKDTENIVNNAKVSNKK